jgi:hypothetical protein
VIDVSDARIEKVRYDLELARAGMNGVDVGPQRFEHRAIWRRTTRNARTATIDHIPVDERNMHGTDTARR